MSKNEVLSAKVISLSGYRSEGVARAPHGEIFERQEQTLQLFNALDGAEINKKANFEKDVIGFLLKNTKLPIPKDEAYMDAFWEVFDTLENAKWTLKNKEFEKIKIDKITKFTLVCDGCVGKEHINGHKLEIIFSQVLGPTGMMELEFATNYSLSKVAQESMRKSRMQELKESLIGFFKK